MERKTYTAVCQSDPTIPEDSCTITNPPWDDLKVGDGISVSHFPFLDAAKIKFLIVEKIIQDPSANAPRIVIPLDVAKTIGLDFTGDAVMIQKHVFNSKGKAVSRYGSNGVAANIPDKEGVEDTSGFDSIMRGLNQVADHIKENPVKKTIIRSDLFVCTPEQFRDIDRVVDPEQNREFAVFKNVPGPRMICNGVEDKVDWSIDIHPEYGAHCHAVNPFKFLGNDIEDRPLRRLFCPTDPFSFMLLKRNGYIDGASSGMFGSENFEVFFDPSKLPPDTNDELEGITDDLFEGELYFYLTAGKGFGGSYIYCGRDVRFPESAKYSRHEMWLAKKFKTYDEASKFGSEHNRTDGNKDVLDESWFEGFSIHFSTKKFTERWKEIFEAKHGKNRFGFY